MPQPRQRAAVIVLRKSPETDEEQILLMHRFNKGEEYYAFVGGGVEEGETPEVGAIRETKEETTMDVEVERELYRINWDDGTQNFFYLCAYKGGEPQLAEDSIEVEQMKAGEQVYDPCWVNVSELPNLTVYQLEIRDQLINDLKTGFADEPVVLDMKLAERRRK